MLSRCYYLFSCLFLIAPALANDSTAELETGGLVLLKSSDIQMLSEDLFISTKEIKIHYVFRNNSPRDIATVIAFPMPRISTNDPGETLEIPNEESDNFLDFSTSVNGRSIPVRAELRAFEGDKEITAILKAAGIPLAPHRQKTQDALDRLNPTKQREFIRNKFVEVEDWDRGNGRPSHLSSRWSLATTYYFDQVFAAGRETTVDHRYRPSVGSSNVTSLGDPNEMSKSSIKDKIEKYCVSDNLLSAIQMAKKPVHMEYGEPFTEERISYILHTGANWAGPIDKFHLVIDKGSPDNLISFCSGDAIRSSPTLVEISKTNFTPKTDFNVLILKPFQ